MSTVDISTFTKFKHSEHEILMSHTLTTLQQENIHTQIATVAELRLALVPDPNDYASFIQQEAHYKGQMDAYKYLLDCSEAAQERVLELAKQVAAVQSQF